MGDQQGLDAVATWPLSPAGGAGAEEASAPGSLSSQERQARARARRWQMRHDNETSPLAPKPHQPVAVWATSGEGLRVGRARVFYTLDGSAPSEASAWMTMAPARIDWDDDAGFVTHWRAVLPAQADGALVRYRIGAWHDADPAATAPPDCWAQDGQGFWYRHPGDMGITTFAYAVEPAGAPLPDWARDAVIYQIFLDRFHPGSADGRFAAAAPHARHGGTLAGVRRALPYLDDLGVTCLWLSPWYPSPSYHRYDAVDLYGVDPALGTLEELRRLTGEAHARGMRVMMDFVPAHCSALHPAFLAAQDDLSAPTTGWFHFSQWPRQYRSFLDLVPSLPALNGDHEGARAHLIQSAVHWLRDGGIDAFRLDHAMGMSMDFWVAFRRATRATRADVFSMGEVTDSPDCLRRYRNRLDAVLDFPLAGLLRATFARTGGDVEALDAFLNAYGRYMVEGPARVAFLDNHDMNRFLFLAGGDVERLKLAALCLFTLPPTPVIYYGTEIGLSQAHDLAAPGSAGDAEARADMPWCKDQWHQGLRASFRALIRLRRESAALRRGAWATLHVGQDTATYAYRRYLADAPRDEMVIVFNLGCARSIVPMGGGGRCELMYATGDVRAVTVNRVAHAVSLPPLSGAVLARSAA
jgi:cyclomaltodextrinase